MYGYTPLLHSLGMHIVSTDELTGIQALERKAPTKRMRPGLVERREFVYERHGTLSAIVNVDVAAGEVTEASLGPARTEQDFTAHIARTLVHDPGGVGLRGGSAEHPPIGESGRSCRGAVRQRMLDFIAYYKQTAKPFKWTYGGRPLGI